MRSLALAIPTPPAAENSISTHFDTVTFTSQVSSRSTNHKEAMMPVKTREKPSTVI